MGSVKLPLQKRKKEKTNIFFSSIHFLYTKGTDYIHQLVDPWDWYCNISQGTRS